MTRLIDADVLTDELIKGMEADTDKSVQATFAKSVCMILCKAIEKQPTINAVPVVRCKDCKYWEDGMRIDRTPVHRCAIDHFVWEADDYCSQAERKEE